MKECDLTTASSSNEIVWAFDLGKGSIGDFPSPRWGEGGRRPDEVNHFHPTTFLHKASLLIPADFAETKTAANRRRLWRTRQAHKAREGRHMAGQSCSRISAFRFPLSAFASVLLPLHIMANQKKKRSREEPRPRRADEFPERGAGVRACGLRRRLAASRETRTGTVLEPG